MRRINFLLVAFGILAAFLCAPAVFAQDEADVSSADAALTAEPTAAVEPADVVAPAADDALEGIKAEEPKAVPSGFGLWWRGVREKVSIALTINPVKKAEKQLKFAEERMNIAKVIMEKSVDPKVQAKAQTMIENAEKFMAKVEEKKDKWINKKDERAQRLLKNIATHQIRRDNILDAIEEKLPEVKQAGFQTLREKAEANGARLLNAINNEKLPEAVKEHLQNVKERVEAHADAVKLYRDEKKELLQKVKSGDETAKEGLKQLQTERKDKLQEIRVNYQEKQRELKEQAVSDDAGAAKKLNILNRMEKKIGDTIEAQRELRQEKKKLLKNKAKNEGDVVQPDGGAGTEVKQ